MCLVDYWISGLLEYWQYHSAVVTHICSKRVIDKIYTCVCVWCLCLSVCLSDSLIVCLSSVCLSLSACLNVRLKSRMKSLCLCPIVCICLSSFLFVYSPPPIYILFYAKDSEFIILLCFLSMFLSRDTVPSSYWLQHRLTGQSLYQTMDSTTHNSVRNSLLQQLHHY